MSTSTMSTVTERVTDVLSTGAGALQDVAAIAVEQFESLPERVADLAGSTKRSSRRPWLLAAGVLIALLGVGWWMRSRRNGSPAVDAGFDGSNPVRSHTDRAVAATGQ